MPLKKDILWRVGVVYVFILLLGMVIAGKILYLQVFQGKELEKKANELNLKSIMVESYRGDIYSCNNRLLASSVPFYDIRLDTRSTGLTINSKEYFKKLDTLAVELAKLFNDKTATEYKNELYQARKEGDRYHLVKEKVNYNQLRKLQEFPLFRKGRYKGGLIVIQRNIRIQPHDNLASRTIGYTTSWDGGNIVGIEGAYNSYLSGIEGVRLMRRIKGGEWIPVSDENEIEPKSGKDVITTIDVNIQDVAESALKHQLIKHNADHGTAVLMEVKTGEIKAIANLGKTKNENYKEIYNYAVGESRAPGSTFKLASIMAALEDNYVDLDDSIDTDDGEIYYYDKKLTDSKPGGYGKISVKEAFEYSSNVGISKIIFNNYKNKENQFIDRIYSMNLNDKLNIEIKGEGEPEIKYPGDKYWSGITLPMMSIGYEIRLTPLQMLTFYNAVANDGKMVKPKFVNKIMDHGKTVKTFETEIINPAICSKPTIRKAQKLLEGVVENGTAKNLRGANYKIAGKTGTAQIANKKYGYSNKEEISHQASFAGYFPADNPKYSCIVVVNAPSKNVYYGNLVAGPVFKEIADKVYATSFEMHKGIKVANKENEQHIPYTKHSHREQLKKVLNELNIEVNEQNIDSKWVVTRKKDSLIDLANRYLESEIMPNVIGMGAKDAIYILENMGLTVKIKGRGSIREQSIPPGTRIEKGEKVTLEMTFSE
jgi:cell division protein FtsI (penicillin-binding protein 3)